MHRLGKPKSLNLETKLGCKSVIESWENNVIEKMRSEKSIYLL